MSGKYATKKVTYKGREIHYIKYLKTWKIAMPDYSRPEREYYFAHDYTSLVNAKKGVTEINIINAPKVPKKEKVAAIKRLDQLMEKMWPL